MANTNNRFFDVVGCIFPDQQSRQCRHQQCDTAGLTQLQCGNRIFVDEGLLNSCFIGIMRDHNIHKAIVYLHQTISQSHGCIRFHRAIGHVHKPGAFHIDNPPARKPEARINPQYANHLRNHGSDIDQKAPEANVRQFCDEKIARPARWPE